MSLSKLASWMNKPVNNNITFHSSSFLQHLYIYIQCLYVPSLVKTSWEIIFQQFVAFWTQIKLACFVPPE